MEIPVKEQLLHILENLGEVELKHFHWYLQNATKGDFPSIKKCHLENADRLKTVDLMVQTYTTDHVIEVARTTLKNMNKGKFKKRCENSLVHTVSVTLYLSSANYV